jgi:hyperosmotically inducible protein
MIIFINKYIGELIMDIKKLAKLLSVIILIILSIQLFSAPNELTPSVKDVTIVSEIVKEVKSEPSLSSYDIQVTSKNGIVTLIGNVNSDTEAATLIEIAESTTGVKDVDVSNLKVAMSNQPLTDVLITSKIKGLFIREKIFGDKNIPLTEINVTTNNGIVYLTGSASNQTQIDNAVNVAKKVKGVKEVVSKITIKNDKTS